LLISCTGGFIAQDANNIIEKQSSRFTEGIFRRLPADVNRARPACDGNQALS
jgi:hypothetical protein